MRTLQVLGGDVSGIVEDSKAAEVTIPAIARALHRLQCARESEDDALVSQYEFRMIKDI